MTQGYAVGAVPESDDVVLLLRRRHDETRELIGQVAAAPADRRREPFERLTRLLVVHETAEQEIVHPLTFGYVRRSGNEGERVAGRRRRTAEEDEEFPLLHEVAGPVALQAMAKAARAAEALAPIRPARDWALPRRRRLSTRRQVWPTASGTPSARRWDICRDAPDAAEVPGRCDLPADAGW
ncbi:hypothetical protein [Streptantibioticus parmotrematis]|uniref:hypothetical protein n=1 Tax=Streptantibioticus parmotrematis TaxID=2873249 RepID=UPI00207C012F|nr:hypothetical protein [Streptantibioticus parmotrematis]